MGLSVGRKKERMEDCCARDMVGSVLSISSKACREIGRRMALRVVWGLA